MKEIWITTSEFFALSGKEKRTLRRHANDFDTRYVIGRGRGGKVLEFELSSLPTEVQQRYYELHNEPAPQDMTESEDYEAKYSGKQKETAAFRMNIVRKYIRSGKSAAAFVRKYKSENPETNLSEWQLREWTERYKTGKHNPESLIDHRGENRTGTGTIKPEIWDYFLSFKLTPQDRSIQLCYDLLKEEFPHENLPSIKTFERKYNSLPEAVKIKAAGIKDRYELKLSSVYRDYSDLRSNDIWCLDHHLSDVLVRNNKGKIVRLWISAILDVRSRKIMSVIIREEYPNKTVIKQGMRIAILKYGLPKKIQTDNGKDYKSNDVVQMLEALDVERTVALPYHGQSKPIERFFGTLESRFGKRCYGYAGHDAKERPDYLRKANKKLESDPNIQSAEDFIKACNAWIETDYAERAHTGDSMDGRTPNQAYADEMGEIRKFDDTMKLAIICGEREERAVRNCCINMYGRTYRPDSNNDSSLIKYNGKHVTLKFIPENIDVLYVYDEKDRFICKVMATVLTVGKPSSLEQYRAVLHDRKVAKKKIDEYMPIAKMSVTDSLINKQYEDMAVALDNKAIEEAFTGNTSDISTSQKKKNQFASYHEAIRKKKEEVG